MSDKSRRDERAEEEKNYICNVNECVCFLWHARKCNKFISYKESTRNNYQLSASLLLLLFVLVFFFFIFSVGNRCGQAHELEKLLEHLRCWSLDVFLACLWNVFLSCHRGRRWEQIANRGKETINWKIEKGQRDGERGKTLKEKRETTEEKRKIIEEKRKRDDKVGETWKICCLITTFHKLCNFFAIKTFRQIFQRFSAYFDVIVMLEDWKQVINVNGNIFLCALLLLAEFWSSKVFGKYRWMDYIRCCSCCCCNKHQASNWKRYS